MSLPSIPFIVALSGPTSSGKTTIANALKTIFPSPSAITLLHADDFYKPDSQIPLHATGVQDWDCAAALDLPKFRETLRAIRRGEDIPDNLIKQGGTEDGVHGHKHNELGETFLQKTKNEVGEWSQGIKDRRIVLVEGFLLFGEGVKDELGGFFDLKILLRASQEEAMKRRKSRNGYVTLEGFWQDPEGYFEEVVWPNFVNDHRFLFEGGDVEGEVRTEGEDLIHVSPTVDTTLQETCEWVLRSLREALLKHG